MFLGFFFFFFFFALVRDLLDFVDFVDMGAVIFFFIFISSLNSCVVATAVTVSIAFSRTSGGVGSAAAPGGVVDLDLTRLRVSFIMDMTLNGFGDPFLDDPLLLLFVELPVVEDCENGSPRLAVGMGVLFSCPDAAAARGRAAAASFMSATCCVLGEFGCCDFCNGMVVCMVGEGFYIEKRYAKVFPLKYSEKRHGKTLTQLH